MDNSTLTLWLQLLTIIVSVLSIVIGYILSKRLEASREIRKYKAELFLEYINISNKIDDNKPDPEIDKDYSASVEKLCLYANQKVLCRIAEFHSKYFKIKNFTKTKEWKKDYSDIVLAMRKDIGLKTKMIDNNMMIDILELTETD